MDNELGASFGIMSALVAFVFIAISIVYSPWFSFIANLLSDLGISDVSFLFNFGLIASGVLGLIFSVYFLKRSPLGYILSIAMISLIGTGIFSLESGPIHTIFSSIFFISSILAMSAFGAIEKGKIRYVSIFLAIISIFAWIPIFGSGMNAINETISSLSFFVFVLFQAFMFNQKT